MQKGIYAFLLMQKDRWNQCDFEAEVQMMSARFRKRQIGCFTGKKPIWDIRLNLFSTAQRNLLAHSISTRVFYLKY
jgi:hypothetical protein